MKKQIAAFLLAAVLLLTAMPMALAEDDEPEGFPVSLEEMMGLYSGEWPKTMYVYTENKGKLNVRSEPRAGDNVIEQLEYGTKVIVESPVIVNPEWSCIRSEKARDGIGYVMTRYLVNAKPKDADKVAEEKERKANLEELNRQLKSARSLAHPLIISVRASRASASLQTFGFRSFCAISMRKTASSSCLRTQQTASGLRQMSANARASPAFADA